MYSTLINNGDKILRRYNTMNYVKKMANDTIIFKKISTSGTIYIKRKHKSLAIQLEVCFKCYVFSFING